MGAYKLRIKIGQHEFEAEGEREEVEKDFEQFNRIVSSLPAPPASISSASYVRESPAHGGGNQEQSIPPVSPTSSSQGALNKIFRVEARRPLSLSVLPQGERREKDAALLLLFGNKELRQQDEVNGIQLLEGLKVSGYNLDRVDRVLHSYVNIPQPLITTSGQRRGLRYRLTNLGYGRAKEIADELIGLVA